MVLFKPFETFVQHLKHLFKFLLLSLSPNKRRETIAITTYIFKKIIKFKYIYLYFIARKRKRFQAGNVVYEGYCIDVLKAIQQQVASEFNEIFDYDLEEADG